MTGYRTEQEAFWAGSFGDEYTERNRDADGQSVESRLIVYAQVARNTGRWTTVLDLGANRGLNGLTIRRLFPQAKVTAVEINKVAAEHLKTFLDDVHVCSIFDFVPPQKYNLVMITGVLIHINPELLPLAYDKIQQSAQRYVLMSDYYNPTPVEVEYRGHKDKLFKRDFAGEFMDRYPEFKLVDYGFTYHRDPRFPLGDDTWFLMERAG